MITLSTSYVSMDSFKKQLQNKNITDISLPNFYEPKLLNDFA